VSFEDCQDLLRHKSGRITTHYSQAELTSCRKAHQKKGPACRAFQRRRRSAKGDHQAAAASNCQFFGMMTASMAWRTPFVAAISACLTCAPLTCTPEVDTDAVSGVP
jgi:hypothetical protein